MMKFSIIELERNSDDGVVVAHWEATQTSGENSASAYGTVGFTPNSSSEAYIPFPKLTKTKVIGWVKKALDTKELKKILDADLAEQVSPSVLTGTPWQKKKQTP
jgi:hypothetical protein